MTGTTHVLMAGGGGVVPGAIWTPPTVRWTASGAASVSASLTFGQQGQSVGQGIGADSSTPGSGTWCYPLVNGVGAPYWIKAALTAGTAPDTGALNTWLNLGTDRVFGWANFATAGTTKTCTLTFQIASDAAGANIITAYGASVITAIHT